MEARRIKMKVEYEAELIYDAEAGKIRSVLVPKEDIQKKFEEGFNAALIDELDAEELSDYGYVVKAIVKKKEISIEVEDADIPIEVDAEPETEG